MPSTYEILTAIDELCAIYGLLCSIKSIDGNLVTMTNGDEWIIGDFGHIAKKEKI